MLFCSSLDCQLSLKRRNFDKNNLFPLRDKIQ